MATYYAWSPISHDGERNAVKLGDEVSASKLGMDDEEFQYLIDTKAVRTQKYPDDIPADMAPADYYKQMAAGTFEGAVPADEPDSPAAPTTPSAPAGDSK